jgi:pimeloyl-ACP methyl ester carboxylesterase
MATYLVCHGAWAGSWAWKRIRDILRTENHEVFVPTYTGLGERAHLANPLVDLETHIQDVTNVIEYEGLTDLILVGHSYGGMVATGLADRVSERFRQMIYVDAFVPQDGESLFDLAGGESTFAAPVEGWLIPPVALAPDTSAEDIAWTTALRRHQPVRTFSQRLRLSHAKPFPPRAYIHCTRKANRDLFRQFADRLSQDPEWAFHGIDASHSPNITDPRSLAQLLLSYAPSPRP